MADPSTTRYDTVLYPGYAREATHPDRMATLGYLFGMNPAPIEGSRILELGCGDGGNLIPIAFSLPGSRCVGIDLSSRAIENGLELIDLLGLKNISLHAEDMMNIGPEFGKFDYIIAHGIYSWVPPAVQEQLLTICKENLSPQGIAFVSYNTYPGWHIRNMVREMMSYHVRNFDDPAQQISQARAILGYLSDAASSPMETYPQVLAGEKKEQERYHDEYLYHDDLAEVNLPLYFHEFAERLGQHGLKFLAEADFTEMQDSFLSPEALDTLGRLSAGQILIKEQFLDFLKGRRFRQTLICHDDVELNRRLHPELMQRFSISSSVRPQEPAEPDGGPLSQRFKTVAGRVFGMDQPLAIGALLSLTESWPRALPFEQLLDRAQALAPAAFERGTERADASLMLGDILLSAYSEGLVELHCHQPAFALEISERPVASPLARIQAHGSTVVTSLLHHRIALGDTLGRQMLLLLDGTRDRAALIEELKRVSEKQIGELEEGSDLTADLESDLVKLAECGLLVG